MADEGKTPEEIAAEQAAAAQAAQEAAAAKAAEEAAKKAAEDAKKTPEQLAAENEANKYRRLHEKAEADRKALEDKLKKIDDEKLTETERLKKEADEAKAERDKLRVENLRQRIAQETGLSADAMEFLSGEDEATLRAQAEKLGKMTKAPAQAGTITNPGAQQQASVDEQIAAAEKAGNVALAITLKRQKAGISRINAQA